MPDALPDPAPTHPELDSLIAVLAVLRAPGGCAWDREQTHRSLVKHLVEETYELVDAIESGSRADLVEELGDVLYQVIFHADLASEDPDEPFTIEDVAAAVRAKMVGRHPHVFGDVSAATPDEVVALWDDLKAEEKSARTSVLDGIPRQLPSLQLVDKLIGRAERVGAAVLSPVAPASAGDSTVRDSTVRDSTAGDATAGAETEAELGRALLALVVGARANGLDAEAALRAAARDLEERIREAEAAIRGTDSRV